MTRIYCPRCHKGFELTEAVPLSERELEVVKLIGKGKSNQSIARDLGIAEGTVKNHVTMCLRKTGSRSRTGAVLWALKERIIFLQDVV